MKRHFLISFLVFAFSYFNITKGNNVVIDQLSTLNGLSQNTVRCILQDRQGFMWFGTINGLNRYDGYKFITYKAESGNVNSLSDSRVRDLYQGKLGHIWIRSYNNKLHCLNPNTNSFLEFYPKNMSPEEVFSYDIFYQNSEGNIWLASAKYGCLFMKYNGKEWLTTQVVKKDNDPHSICDNNISFVFEDSRKNTWIGTPTGLSLISKENTDNQTFSAENYFNKNADHKFVQAIEYGTSIYFLTRKGVIIFNSLNKAFTYVEGPPRVNLTGGVLSGPGEVMLQTTNQGLLVFNERKKELTRIPLNFDINPNIVAQIVPDKAGGFWVSNQTGEIFRVDSINKETKKFVLINPSIEPLVDNERFQVVKDHRGKVWISTYGGGIYNYDPQSRDMVHYSYNPLNAKGISSDYILSIFCDRTGVIWTGAEHTGINKICYVKNNFDSYLPSADITNPSSNFVRAIYEDPSGALWVSTKDGRLHVYDNHLKKTNEFDPILRKLGNTSNIYCFYQDSRGRFWIGTKGEGVYYFERFNRNSPVYHERRDPFVSGTMTSDLVYGFAEDNHKRLWIATFGGGINLVDEGSDKKMTFRSFLGNVDGLRQIRCIMFDSKGKIWAGTSDGLVVFDPDSIIANPNNFKHYTSKLEQKNTLLSNEVKVITEDHNREIWIGTSAGLNKFIPASATEPEHFEKYTSMQGLPNDIIQTIVEDNNNSLWIGTENGLSRFDLRYRTFENFRLSNNILGNLISELAGMRLMNGDLIWGSANGFYKVDPKNIRKDTISHPVTLTNFLLSGVPLEPSISGSPLERSVSVTSAITLNHTQHSFSIEFGSLIFDDDQQQQYSYILENYDNQWNQVANYNVASYKNLSPGKYIFKVKTLNPYIKSHEKITQLQITVLPPFWKSQVAIFIYIILSVIILIIIRSIIIRISSLQHSIEVEKQLTEYKMKFFTNISHEFRTPLSLILGSMERISDSIKLTPAIHKHFVVMKRNTNRLMMLIDQLLDFAKIQNNNMKLNLQETEVISFVREIYESFTDLAEKKEIHYTFTTNCDSCTLFIDQAIIDKIAYNLLSNSFKFTPDFGIINFDIEADFQLQTLKLKVTDNGQGIPVEKQQLIFKRFAQIQTSTTGIGLSLTRELTELHHGHIEFDSTPGVQTTFAVNINCNPGAYKPEDFSKKAEAAAQPKHTPVVEVDEEEQFTAEKLEAINDNKILIIEDNPEIRDYLADYLAKYFKTDVAENGKEGFDKATDDEPDLIICDIMMPEMDGFEFTRRLKSDFSTSHIPIILLTALTSDENKIKGTEAGADAYVTKPFSIKFLLSKIIQLIEQRESLRKKFSTESTGNSLSICKTEKDKQFLEKVNKIAEENMINPEFSVDHFAKIAGLGRTVFYKKLKGITGFTPNEYIRVIRLKKAMELLSTGDFTVSEVSHKVGMSDPFYFSRCFKAQFGQAPSVYIKGR